MGLAEEEVLIRDDSGLLLEDGESRLPRRYEWCKKLQQTLCLSVAFLVLVRLNFKAEMCFLSLTKHTILMRNLLKCMQLAFKFQSVV